MPNTQRRFRGPIIAFAIAVVLGLTSYVLSPVSYAVGGYPGPDALPGVPTYGTYLGTIPVGGHSPVSYVCGLDAPNGTNHSPKFAIGEINGHISAYIPISTEFGCAQFVVFVKALHAKCGFAYASINGGKWILIHYGVNYVLITGIKHYRHVGAYFPFFVPAPNPLPPGCVTTTTTTTTSIPNTSVPTTIPGQTTTSRVHPTSTTFRGHETTSSIYNAGSTSTIPQPINKDPGTDITSITDVTTLIAVVLGAGAAAAGAGQFFTDIPEALVEEYTTEIPPGGGLPYNLFPTGGAGTLSEEEVFIAAGASTEIPIGGGYVLGSFEPDGTVADEYFALPLGRLEEDDEAVKIFYGGDTEIPPGGGVAMREITDQTGGLAGESSTGSGGAAQ